MNTPKEAQVREQSRLVGTIRLHESYNIQTERLIERLTSVVESLDPNAFPPRQRARDSAGQDAISPGWLSYQDAAVQIHSYNVEELENLVGILEQLVG